MRRWMLNTLIVIAVAVLFGIAFMLGNQKEVADGDEVFGGTDAAATEMVEEANPDYEPWFSPLFEAESGEIESGLFALQAAIGAGVLGFALGALWQRNRPRTDAHGSVVGPSAPHSTDAR